MFRKTLVTSVLVLASISGFCSQAKAETIDVPFSGTVAPKCTFSNVSAGTLAIGSSPNLLEGSKSFGSQGSVDIFCNTAATIKVGEPADNGSIGPSKFPGSFYGSIITVGSASAGSPQAVQNNWQSVSSTSLGINSTTTTNIKVSVVRDAGAAATIQAGVYKFKTTLTSTP